MARTAHVTVSCEGEISLEKALKKFRNKVIKSGLKQEMYKTRSFLPPGENRRMKEKKAKSRRRKK
jgi:ribosomal protein S21